MEDDLRHLTTEYIALQLAVNSVVTALLVANPKAMALAEAELKALTNDLAGNQESMHHIRNAVERHAHSWLSSARNVLQSIPTAA